MVTFELNGQTVSTEDSSDTPLLWVVRDTFKLKGSKFGCGSGLCGACTMHVDGQSIRTCVLPVGSIAGKSVTTIEGLSQGNQLHPVQEAWVSHNVPQCGYCQSGQIMTAAALLESNANPSPNEVESAMAGNLCRCGCYPRIKQAVLAAALATNASEEEMDMEDSA